MHHFQKRLLLAGVLGVAWAAAPEGIKSGSPAQAAPPQVSSVAGADAERCKALAGAHQGKLEVQSAVLQPAGDAIPGAIVSPSGAKPIFASGLPTFCRVVGSIHPEPGSDIRFELWMPLNWNGRYLGVGNGGFAGSIRYRDLGAAISAGFASASTDTGHQDTLDVATWVAHHPAKITDYAWRGIHLTTLNAKSLVGQFYGSKASKSYFQSCSNGGRQGLMEAARFPEDYDGVIAGAPAAEMTRAIGSLIWAQQVQLPAGAAFRADQMPFLQAAVLKQCDGLDGRQDGIVENPLICHFRPEVLSCGSSSSPQCFSNPQLMALRRLYAGPPAVRNVPRSFAYPATGAEAGRPVPFLGWEGSIAAAGSNPAQGRVLAQGVLGGMLNPPTTIEKFDWNTDSKKLVALADILDVPLDLSRFFNRGGKLIVYQGWADALVPPQQTISYYRRFVAKSGSLAATGSRLFMIPGMQHCFGGTGAENFGEAYAPASDAKPENNITAALLSWVEQGRAPSSVVGTSSAYKPDESTRERLHCAWPAHAVLRKGADPDKAANYVCKSTNDSRR